MFLLVFFFFKMGKLWIGGGGGEIHLPGKMKIYMDSPGFLLFIRHIRFSFENILRVKDASAVQSTGCPGVSLPEPRQVSHNCSKLQLKGTWRPPLAFPGPALTCTDTHRDTPIHLKKKYFQGTYSKCHLCFASRRIFMIKVITTRWLVFNVLCNEKYTGRSQLLTGADPTDSSFLCNLSVSSVSLPAGYLQVAQCVTWPKAGTPYVCLLYKATRIQSWVSALLSIPLLW